MKKFATLALVAVMAVSSVMPAFAAGSKSGHIGSTHSGSGSGSGSGSSAGSSPVVSNTASGSGAVTYANRAETNGHWVQNADGTWSLANDEKGAGVWTGWVVKNNQWYYIGANGKMLEGWQLINGTWYYLAANRAANQPKGSLYQAKSTPDNYKVDGNGAWVR